MSIQEKTYTSKKTGKTTLKYYACVFDPITKSPIWGKGRIKRADAVRDEAQLLEDIEKGIQKTTGSKLFKEVAELWFESMKSTYAESTFIGYKGYYTAKLAPIFDDIPVSKIKPINVQRFKNELSNENKPATVNKTLYLLSMILDFAIKPLHLIKYNPCDDIKRDKVVSTDWVTWDEKTIGYFLSLKEVRDSEYYEMFCVTFTTGLRPGEVCGIWTTDLLKNGTLSLSRGFNKYGNITDMKTARSHRPIELNSFVYDMLIAKREHKQIQRKNFERKIREIALESGSVPDVRYNENNFLFTYENGDPITPNSYSRAFRNIIKHHNTKLAEMESITGKLPKGTYYLPQIRLYDGRHSFATNTIIAGKENAKIVSEIMGSSVTTVMKNYVHTGKEEHHAALSRYANKIFNIEEIRAKNTAN